MVWRRVIVRRRVKQTCCKGDRSQWARQGLVGLNTPAFVHGERGWSDQGSERGLLLIPYFEVLCVHVYRAEAFVMVRRRVLRQA